VQPRRGQHVPVQIRKFDPLTSLQSPAGFALGDLVAQVFRSRICGVHRGLSPVEQAFRGLSFFFSIDVVTVAVLMLFPSIVTWLPTFLG
jgi:TRAP-type mannitol/chloroaromatic compound transport system permease large subunit